MSVLQKLSSILYLPVTEYLLNCLITVAILSVVFGRWKASLIAATVVLVLVLVGVVTRF